MKRVREPIFVCDGIPQHVAEQLEIYFELIELAAIQNDACSPYLPNARIMISGSVKSGNQKIDSELISKVPNLRLIAGFGAGYDRIDVRAAWSHSVIITNTPNFSVDDVAEFSIGLLIAAARGIPQADRFVREGRWHEGDFSLSEGTFRGRHLGIVGLGSIGKAVAARAAAFGMSISYFGRRRQEDTPYEFYDNLLALSEDVFVSIIGGEATRHLVDKTILDALGFDGILINISRGSVVEESALRQTLRERRFLAAGLDVFQIEPDV